MSVKLKLGPLPDESTVRVTTRIPTPLKAQLDQYAKLHSKSFGIPVDTEILIPLMLAAFIEKDKVFQRALRQSSTD